MKDISELPEYSDEAYVDPEFKDLEVIFGEHWREDYVPQYRQKYELFYQPGDSMEKLPTHCRDAAGRVYDVAYTISAPMMKRFLKILSTYENGKLRVCLIPKELHELAHHTASNEDSAEALDNHQEDFAQAKEDKSTDTPKNGVEAGEARKEAKVDKPLNDPEETREINYLIQNRNFQLIAGVIRLNPRSRVLYDQLLEINNRSFWKKEFSASNEYLERVTGTSNWGTLNKARQALLDAGLISYHPGHENFPGRYSITKLYDPIPEEFVQILIVAKRLAERECQKMRAAMELDEERVQFLVNNCVENFVDSSADKAADKAVDKTVDKTVDNSEEDDTTSKSEEGVYIKNIDRGSTKTVEGVSTKTADTPPQKVANLHKLNNTLLNNNKQRPTDRQPEDVIHRKQLMEELTHQLVDVRGTDMYTQEKEALRGLLNEYPENLVKAALKKAVRDKTYYVSDVKRVIDNLGVGGFINA